MVSRASRRLAAGICIAGMLLIGFGFLIWVLRELFAMLFSVVFVIIGVGCIMTAIRIFWAQHKLEKYSRDDTEGYRDNVRIHIEEHCEQ